MGHGNKTTAEYAISIDMAKELGMIENNRAGKIIRKYFIAMEKKAKQITQYALPTPRQLAQWFLQAQEKNEALVKSCYFFTYSRIHRQT